MLAFLMLRLYAQRLLILQMKTDASAVQIPAKLGWRFNRRVQLARASKCVIENVRTGRPVCFSFFAMQ